MNCRVSPKRIADCYQIACETLLAERTKTGHWVGELSTSALSTATAVMALHAVNLHKPNSATNDQWRSLIDRGLIWLANHQDSDGGWGDTTKSRSNVSTTMLAHAVFHATGTANQFARTVRAAKNYIDRTGGIPAVLARYGKDKTFSVPILTHCALAGLVEWQDITPLPFELACLSPRFYKMVRLPVVSYALPALIAIGQVHYFHRKPLNPVIRLIRKLAINRSLKVLERIQPSNGGFLEATPITSFITMSLADMGLVDHPVTQRAVRFLVNSVRDDGSWPVDTNLATWLTTLSVNALREALPVKDQPAIREWLLQQQHRQIHPYTNADPGGWAWTDLPGGVPDSDDTPGAILALLSLQHSEMPASERQSLAEGVRWLLNLQNRDKGWPTFCRGWGVLPFDRSSPDLTAHTIRAMSVWFNHPASTNVPTQLIRRAKRAVNAGFDYLTRSQRADGSWCPLWFGNQFGHDDQNPTYGTARVLTAYRDTAHLNDIPARKGIAWLRNAQNDDGGWGGAAEIASSVEETALALDVLLADSPDHDGTRRGLSWLMDRVEDGTFREATPIGFYFLKLWYFERLYPVTFSVSALGRAYHCAGGLANVNLLEKVQNQTAKVGVESSSTIRKDLGVHCVHCSD